MGNARKRYPKAIHHLRWCRNGAVPDTYLATQLVEGLNHVIAYRRKLVMSCCELGSLVDGSAGTTTNWRARFKSGRGVSSLRFRLGLGLDNHNSGDARVDVDVTESGGSTTTIRVDFGDSANGSGGDAPSTIGWFTRTVSIDAETVYEIAIKGIDGGRPLCVLCHEYADPEVDESRGFAELSPTAGFDITSDFRKEVFRKLCSAWLENGAHLFTWPGKGNGTARSVTGTTWTNLLDLSSTSVTGATPGYTFNSAGSGSTALATLLPLVRLSGSNDLPVTLCAFANTDAGSTGEVRLVDSASAGVSLTGITTTLQWHTTNTTLSNVDSIAGSGKLDLQLRNGTAGQTTNVYAVCLYARGA